jgi:hypothetical protein
MHMDRDLASRIAIVARSMVDEGRWSPEPCPASRLLDLERFLPISIQPGQPALEAMNDRMILDAASDVLAAATVAMASGGISRPTPRDVGLFGSPPPLRAVENEPFGLFARAA